MITSIVAAGELANKFYERHESANMRTTVVTNQYPSLKVAFPAVTLCQGNLVSIQRLSLYLKKPPWVSLLKICNFKIQTIRLSIFYHCRVIPEGLSLSDFGRGLEYLDEMVYPLNEQFEALEKLQRILDANQIELLTLLESLSPNCSDLLTTCVFEGKKKPCDELFAPTITPFGICCSSNNAIQKVLSKRFLLLFFFYCSAMSFPNYLSLNIKTLKKWDHFWRRSVQYKLRFPVHTFGTLEALQRERSARDGNLRRRLQGHHPREVHSTRSKCGRVYGRSWIRDRRWLARYHSH